MNDSVDHIQSSPHLYHLLHLYDQELTPSYNLLSEDFVDSSKKLIGDREVVILIQLMFTFFWFLFGLAADVWVFHLISHFLFELKLIIQTRSPTTQKTTEPS
jgi:uncharacterized ion transporter superfamily protein YfcC